MQDGALQANMRRVLLHGLQTPLLLAQIRTRGSTPRPSFSECLCNFVS